MARDVTEPFTVSGLTQLSIGNAETAGMGKDLGLTSSDYSLAVSLFFIGSLRNPCLVPRTRLIHGSGYVCLQIPSNLLITRVRPRFYLPGIQFVRGPSTW